MATFSALIAVAAASVVACGLTSSSGTEILVFDCYLPLPEGFVLNSRERDRFRFFRRSSDDITEVVVDSRSAFKGLDKVYETLESHDIGGIKLEKLHARQASGSVDVDNLTILTDDEQIVLVYAPNEKLVRQMVDGCVRNRLEHFGPDTDSRPGRRSKSTQDR